MKPSRFDYVQYDVQACEQQAALKATFQLLERQLDVFPESRAKSLVFTHLEEAYMWSGKAIRDEQIRRNGSAPMQEGRVNS
jgi:hypothetical protein